MTKDDIRAAIKDIQAESWDPEAAHCKEDRLREDFIAYIANMPPAVMYAGNGVSVNLPEMAKMVLETNDINFTRWCG
jgi:hypothetical protein